MAVLNLIMAPHPIFKMKAEPITFFSDDIKQLAQDMLDTIYYNHAVGMGANMIGILARIAVVDLQTKGQRSPYVFINPEIVWKSDETQTHEEASICFPGIAAEITRAMAIKVKFVDVNGEQQEMEASGPLATVIQHELDYLDGIVFLDYLSKMKRDLLINKMQKFIKMHPPHVHGPGCHH